MVPPETLVPLVGVDQFFTTNGFLSGGGRSNASVVAHCRSNLSNMSARWRVSSRSCDAEDPTAMVPPETLIRYGPTGDTYYCSFPGDAKIQRLLPRSARTTPSSILALWHRPPPPPRAL